MDWLSSLVGWPDVPFLVPVLFALLFMAFQIVGFGLGEALHGASGADADADAHVDADADADADVDADADADADAPVDAASPGAGLSALAWFNLGRVPFTVIVECFLLTFGAVGLLANRMTPDLGIAAGPARVAVAIPVALGAAVVLTKLLSGFFARCLPTIETKTVTPRSLVGQVARVASAAVDEKHGRAVLRDRDGDLHTIFCKVAPGDPPVPKGDEVVLLSWRAAEGGLYLVKRQVPQA